MRYVAPFGQLQGKLGVRENYNVALSFEELFRVFEVNSRSGEPMIRKPLDYFRRPEERVPSVKDGTSR